ncbi:Mepce, partial [Symbiodinium pilosum]
DYYGIRNPGGEDPRLPWLRETVCWEGKCVLDLGCNSGHITRAIVAEGAKLALGVDVDPVLIDEANERTSSELLASG